MVCRQQRTDIRWREYSNYFIENGTYSLIFRKVFFFMSFCLKHGKISLQNGHEGMKINTFCLIQTLNKLFSRQQNRSRYNLEQL